MITSEKNPNGSLTLTALVQNYKLAPFSWYESRTFYGYPLSEAKQEFRAYLKEHEMKQVKAS